MPIFHLDLKSPLHLGEYLGVFREAVLDRIPSDSLFAAIVTAWARRGVDIEARLAGMRNGEDPPFTLTSAFPRAGDVRFYPVPSRLPSHAGFAAGDKTAKRLRWFSQGVLDQLRTGQQPANQENVNLLQGKTIWLTTEEFDKVQGLLRFDAAGKLGLWSEQIAPRVTVDRTTNASNLFFSGRLTFAPGCGLWFALRGRTDWVAEALDVLQDEGLGGLRSIGHGSFTWERAADDLPSAATNGWGYCLSRFAPANESEAQALKNRDSVYALETIGGWCNDDAGQPWRRRSVRMLAEGALLPVDGLTGKTVETRPENVGVWQPKDRPVWRVGYAFFLPAGQLVEVTS